MDKSDKGKDINIYNKPLISGHQLSYDSNYAFPQYLSESQLQVWQAWVKVYSASLTIQDHTFQKLKLDFSTITRQALLAIWSSNPGVIFRGIPQRHRFNVWFISSGARDAKAANPGIYALLCEQHERKQPKFMKAIIKDVI